MQRSVESLVGGAFHADRPVLLEDADLLVERLFERPQGALHGHGRTRDADLDTAGDLDGLLPDP